jgi:hypothetical protein
MASSWAQSATADSSKPGLHLLFLLYRKPMISFLEKYLDFIEWGIGEHHGRSKCRVARAEKKKG